MTRLLADAHRSRRMVEVCLRLDPDFPIVHLADCFDEAFRNWITGSNRGCWWSSGRKPVIGTGPIESSTCLARDSSLPGNTCRGHRQFSSHGAR